MTIENSIPDFMREVINILDRLEDSMDEDFDTILLEKILETHSPYHDSMRREEDIGKIIDIFDWQREKMGTDTFNIIPTNLGRPGLCREVLVVVVRASKTLASGATLRTSVSTKALEDLILEAHKHVERCHDTQGIIFWLFSSWHQFIWERDRYMFYNGKLPQRIYVALKIHNCGAVMI